jgi:serine/threonine-protein kinase
LKYEIRALIGHGDHAYVYEAYDPLLDRTVAIKLIPESPNSRRDLVQRSPDLAPLLRELRHPNLVSVYDVGTVGDELVYIIMDRLIGRTLRSVLLKQHTLTPLELLPIGIQVAEGMARAHLQQIIHRDLKPENVFITENREVKVINAGITSFVVPSGMTTERDWVRGTLLYMSPEHIQGFGVTARSDIFSLGTLLYECLVGSPPVLVGAKRLSLDDVAWRQIAQMPPPLDELLPEVPSTVARLIQQMLAKEAALRFGTMDEVAIRLRSCHSQLLAEASGKDADFGEGRPYIVFPSAAIGMNARRAGSNPGDVVGVDEAPTGQEPGSMSGAGPAVMQRKLRQRLLFTAICLGVLGGIAVALFASWPSKPAANDRGEQPPAPSNREPEPGSR